jgi:hypothetical protein
MTIADVSTMAFLDVMPLACVAGSTLARAANESRYSEFFDVADFHLSDLRSQVSRLSPEADSDTRVKCEDVERGPPTRPTSP